MLKKLFLPLFVVLFSFNAFFCSSTSHAFSLSSKNKKIALLAGVGVLMLGAVMVYFFKQSEEKKKEEEEQRRMRMRFQKNKENIEAIKNGPEYKKLKVTYYNLANLIAFLKMNEKERDEINGNDYFSFDVQCLNLLIADGSKLKSYLNNPTQNSLENKDFSKTFEAIDRRLKDLGYQDNKQIFENKCPIRINIGDQIIKIEYSPIRAKMYKKDELDYVDISNIVNTTLVNENLNPNDYIFEIGTIKQTEENPNFVLEMKHVFGKENSMFPDHGKYNTLYIMPKDKN